MKLKLLVAILAVGLVASAANATVYINEVLGSTTGTDSEFIELYNSGPGAVDISNWTIELWDSDSGSIGGADGGSPYLIPAATSLAAGGYYLMANPTFATYYTATPDFALPANAIENSSYTMILTDAALTPVDSFFVWDSGVGDIPNRAGAAYVPISGTVGPDGSFLPAGFYRVGDGNPATALLEFSPQPAPSATPGAMNLPEPGTLVLLASGALFALRRRK
jgi:hypothetical protein